MCENGWVVVRTRGMHRDGCMHEMMGEKEKEEDTAHGLNVTSSLRSRYVYVHVISFLRSFVACHFYTIVHIIHRLDSHRPSPSA